MPREFVSTLPARRIAALPTEVAELVRGLLEEDLFLCGEVLSVNSGTVIWTMTSIDRVLITGVDTRLGAAVRDHFAGRGALTVGTVTAERDPGPGEELTLTADPADRAEVGHVVAKAAAHMGGVDVLVVAHGLPVVAPLADQPMAEFWAHVDATLTGSFLYAQAAADHMRHSGTGGRIVLTTSRWHVGGDGLAAVATAAGGIVALDQIADPRLRWLRGRSERRRHRCPGFGMVGLVTAPSGSRRAG